MPDEPDGLDRDQHGRIIAHKLTALQTSEQGLVVFVRMEWAEDRPRKPPRARSVQLYLPPDAAREIGENLVRVAGQHAAPSGKHHPDG